MENKSLGHFMVSLVKSIIRIISCIGSLVTANIFYMALGFIVAEILGIVEELVDKRK